MPNFMLVSLNARFLLKIDLICLASSARLCINLMLKFSDPVMIGYNVIQR